MNLSNSMAVQPTHHGGVWGFVPFLPNSRHVQHSQQSTPQIHNKSWRCGNLHHSVWVEGHTGVSWSIPTAHPCSQNGRRLWVARKHHNQTSPMRTNHTRNYHIFFVLFSFHFLLIFFIFSFLWVTPGPAQRGRGRRQGRVHKEREGPRPIQKGAERRQGSFFCFLNVFQFFKFVYFFLRDLITVIVIMMLSIKIRIIIRIIIFYYN